MGKNDNKYSNTKSTGNEAPSGNVDVNTDETNLVTPTEDGIQGLDVNSGTQIEPSNGEIIEGESKIMVANLAGTFVDDAEDIANALLENANILLQDETDKEEVIVSKTLTLADAIEVSKNNTVEETIEILLTDAILDIKVYAAELKDIITAYSIKSELESNNGNRKLYSLLQRVLRIEDGTEFKFKFDIVNKLFKDVEYFQPVTLLNCTKWSKSEKELANFAQVITIIEDLADRSTRNENKKRIGNLSNLTLDEKALENIKNYYKL